MQAAGLIAHLGERGHLRLLLSTRTFPHGRDTLLACLPPTTHPTLPTSKPSSPQPRTTARTPPRS
ncbi:hypothetical protein PLANTIT3_50087 [Plantibacter sp. T3]|nr:hypothetical protein PLANTIT3_50087 [Plantibacter sp. T3]